MVYCIPLVDLELLFSHSKLQSSFFFLLQIIRICTNKLYIVGHDLPSWKSRTAAVFMPSSERNTSSTLTLHFYGSSITSLFHISSLANSLKVLLDFKHTIIPSSSKTTLHSGLSNHLPNIIINNQTLYSWRNFKE